MSRRGWGTGDCRWRGLRGRPGAGAGAVLMRGGPPRKRISNGAFWQGDCTGKKKRRPTSSHHKADSRVISIIVRRKTANGIEVGGRCGADGKGPQAHSRDRIVSGLPAGTPRELRYNPGGNSRYDGLGFRVVLSPFRSDLCILWSLFSLGLLKGRGSPEGDLSPSGGGRGALAGGTLAGHYRPILTIKRQQEQEQVSR